MAEREYRTKEIRRGSNTKNAPFCDNTHLAIGFRDPPLRPATGPKAPG